MSELKACPFCGEVHREVHWNKVTGYNAKEGLPILGQLNIGVDLTVHNPGGATVYIPIDVYNARPIEDAQAAEIERLKAELLERDFIWLPEKDAEIERLQAAIDVVYGYIGYDNPVVQTIITRVGVALAHQSKGGE